MLILSNITDLVVRDLQSEEFYSMMALLFHGTPHATFQIYLLLQLEVSFCGYIHMKIFTKIDIVLHWTIPLAYFGLQIALKTWHFLPQAKLAPAYGEAVVLWWDAAYVFQVVPSASMAHFAETDVKFRFKICICKIQYNYRQYIIFELYIIDL